MSAADHDINQYEEAVTAARDTVLSSLESLNYNEERIESIQDDIPQAQHDITQAQERIREVELKRRRVSEMRPLIANAQDKMKQVYHKFGLLSGVGRAVELNTRFYVELTGIVGLTKELAVAVGRITGQDPLYVESIQNVMLLIKENQRGVDSSGYKQSHIPAKSEL